MDTLHTVLRSLGETKSRPDPVGVFREFLGHLDRIGRRGEKSVSRRGTAASRSRKK